MPIKPGTEREPTAGQPAATGSSTARSAEASSDSQPSAARPYAARFKSRMGWRRVINAWRYSMQGLDAAIRHEASFRQELLLAVVLVPAAFWLGRDLIQILLLLMAVFVVLITELLNSAMEAVADAVSLDRHPLIGRAKDIGSAAVWVAFLMLFVVWGGVAIHRFT